MTGPRIIVLSGPTASGKSGLALALAREFRLEIVNADSLQVYRHLDIGTAKPTRKERAEVPHHLIDVADPDEPYNAGRYVADAEKSIAEIAGRGNVPLVVGGTGMYLRALLRGLDPVPADPAVRAALDLRWKEGGGKALYAELARIDPETAARVHPADRLRIVRALEIARVGGVPASKARAAWAVSRGRYRSLFLALWPDRQTLYRRIDARAEGMFREGLLDEVRSLLQMGYARELKPLGALGYRQAIAHLLDHVPLSEAVESTKRDTRRYAKRQLTWLAAEPGLERVDPAEAFRDTARKVNMFLS
ncbi:MAG: miaA [Deltaproteobacteria bacterium]|nr:miaA [Deltaproteobacteria bacterium]